MIQVEVIPKPQHVSAVALDATCWVVGFYASRPWLLPSKAIRDAAVNVNIIANIGGNRLLG
jgi:hypothetical protein